VAYKNAHGVSGNLQVQLPASNTATVMQLDPASAAQLQVLLSPGDWTYMQLDTGALTEVVLVNYSATQNFTITRQQDGTALNAHVVGAPARFVLVAAAVATLVTPPTLNITGTGLASASTSGEDVTIAVADPEFTGDGIQISGSWPSLNFTITADDTNCCGGSGSGGSSGITGIYGYGIASVTQSGSTASITVPAPNFTSPNSSVTIGGSWPNLTFESTSGGSGTVTVVNAGSGITVTGNPNISPTIGLSATGVTAGTYGAMVVNAFGQITSLDSDFDPPSTITATAPLIATRTGDALALTISAAEEGVPGVAPLADSTEPLDPTDHTSAVTPALLASVVDALSGAAVSGFNNYSPAPTANYSNIVSASPVPVSLAAGQSALVLANITMLNTSTPLTPVAFGMAVFNNSAALIQGDQSATQSQRSMSFILTGPLTTSLVLTSTAVPSGASITASGLQVIVF
jgi:hypothetical protein